MSGLSPLLDEIARELGILEVENMGIGNNWQETGVRREMISPDQRGAGTVTTGWWPITANYSLIAEILVGEMAAGATLDAKLQQASDASGTGAKDLKIADQLTDTDDDVLIDLQATFQEVDTANAFSHVRISITTAVGNVDFAATLSEYWVARPLLRDLNEAFVTQSK